MKTLIVGAGATGGYIGVQLMRAGRDVTFLVRSHALSRLRAEGVRIRSGDAVSATQVHAITTADLDTAYDVVVVGVRSDAVESSLGDFRAAVGAGTKIIPLTNGMAHLATLVAAFGEDAVLGATAKLATSLLADGTIDEVVPGVQLEIGSLDGAQDVDRVAAEFAVDGISVSVTDAVQVAMWEKFAFITSTAVLTCLAGDVIGGVARASGGIVLAGRVFDEVAAVAAAEGYPLSEPATASLTALLSDTSSRFAPSMYRDFQAGRRVETSVFADLASRARRHNLDTPLLDTCMVALDVRAHLVDSG